MPVRLLKAGAAMHALENAFPYLDDAGRDRLLAHARQEQYPADAVIVAEESRPAALFVLLEGRAAVAKDHLGIPIPIGEVRQGELFGEVSYLDGSPASASVVARESATVLVLSDVDTLLRDAPELASGFYHSLAVALARRLRFSADDRVALGFLWG
jgi:CRP-like cAMP-binding protein